MTARIETLESRCLLSATLPANISADITKLTTDGLTAKADFLTYYPTLKADLAAVHTALVKTGARNNVLAAKLRADDLRAYQTFKSGVTTFAATEVRVARKIFADGLRLIQHPGNEVLVARLSDDASVFAAAGTAVLNKFGEIAATASAAAAADLTAIAAANPSNTALTTAITSVTTDGGAFVTAIGTDSQAIETDLGTLVSDVSATI